MRMFDAPGIFERVSLAREELRACRVTLWPLEMRDLARLWPMPSEEPVMNIRAMFYFLMQTIIGRCVVMK